MVFWYIFELNKVCTKAGDAEAASTLSASVAVQKNEGMPVVRTSTPGYGYSTIAWIPEIQGSWALPLRHERITSWENPIDKAVWQLRQVCQHLPSRPITLWDIEYGCATPVASSRQSRPTRGLPFVIKIADIPADKLMRLRSNLCFWGEPPKYSGRGKPRVHGDKFKLNDSVYLVRTNSDH